MLFRFTGYIQRIPFVFRDHGKVLALHIFRKAKYKTIFFLWDNSTNDILYLFKYKNLEHRMKVVNFLHV